MALILPLRIVAVALREWAIRTRRRWRLYVQRRRHYRAMAQLQVLSDRSLKDIGVPRSEIRWLAQHGRYERHRHPVAPLGR
jgi:uncharacterized protein YjiS (DUF1127 family)